MVYIQTWSEYQKLAEELYEKHPTRTRYCVKYRGAEGVLVLKVTDDDTTLKYRTKSSIMLNRFEAFNLSIMSKMQNRRPQAPVLSSITPARSGVPADSHAHGTATTSDVVMADASGGQTAGNAGTAGAGGAKKKKPKKKK